MPLTTGRLAKQSGVHLETIRFYERSGLLPEPPRLASGYRLFPQTTVRRIHFIRRAQELGFTLAEIRELLDLAVSRHKDRAEVRSIARTRLAQINSKLASLTAMKRALEHLADQCTGHGPADACPILQAIDSQVEDVLATPA